MSIDFTGLPTATLLDLQSKYTDCLAQIAVVGQSYSIGGRSFSFANIGEVSKLLMDINTAIARKAGRGASRTWGNFRRRGVM